MNSSADPHMRPIAFVLSVLIHCGLLALVYFRVPSETVPSVPVLATLWSSVPSIPAPSPAMEAPESPVPQEEPTSDEHIVPVPIKIPKSPHHAVPATRLSPPKKASTGSAPAKRNRAQTEQQMQRDIQREVDAESNQIVQRQLNAAAAAAYGRAVYAYQRQVAELVRRLIVFDDTDLQNYEAQFDVPMLPNREILDVQLTKSSGNAAYDAAVARAIVALRRLPPPPDGVVLDRVNRFHFKLRG